MKRYYFLKALLISLIAPLVWLTACKEGTNEAAVAKENAQKYTCSMHPQVVQNKPGTCPICGMDLVPVNQYNADEFIHLDERQQALANITTITVGAGELLQYTQLNGRLAIDPQQTESISSRVPGRLEALFVKETGVLVKKGQPLYEIYSEQLATLQQEYLIASVQAAQFPDDNHFQQIVKAARQKLLLYDMTEAQLLSIVKTKKINPYVTYSSPVNGVVAELSVTEGQYVGEGSAIMRLEGYGNLWVEADVYPSEAASIKEGQKVKVIIPGWEDQPQSMTIHFTSPALQPGSQLLQIRGTIPNPYHQWQPGLQAFVLLPARSTGTTLTLPLNAIIREEKGTHVWIENGKGKYEPRIITTGMETSDQVEITSGLQEGDKVVITGAYLLYSEFILKKGKNPIAGHNHG